MQKNLLRFITKKQKTKFPITVIDRGEGFDWKKYMEFDPERATGLTRARHCDVRLVEL